MTTPQHFTLSLLATPFSVCQLAPGTPLPRVPDAGEFFSLTITDDEISLVCASVDAPLCDRRSDGFRAFKVAGPLDFALVGVLSAIADTLASAQISIFVVSTFDTDYVMCGEHQLDKAISNLRDAGHTIIS